MDETTYVTGLVIAIAVILLLRSIISYYQDSIRAAWWALFMKGPFPWPIVGNSTYMLTLDKWMEYFRIYGEVGRFWLPTGPMVAIMSPWDIKKVLTNPKHIDKWRIGMKLTESFFGNGLSSQEGTIWKVHRKLMQPIFHRSKIDERVECFQKGSTAIVERLESLMGNEEQKALNTTSICNEFVFRITAEFVLGVPLNSEQSVAFEEISPFRKSNGPKLLFDSLIYPWTLIPLLLRSTLTASAAQDQEHKETTYAFTKKVLQERKSMNLEKPECVMDSFLQIHQENPEQFSEDDCINQAITLMFAGQDSTATAMACALHCLANNPEIQQKVCDELDAIFEGSDRLANVEDLRRMTYLDQCVKETMRLYPSLPIILRTLGEDTKLGGYTVCKGTPVAMYTYVTHRMPEIYPDPEKFNPDRFSPYENSMRVPYSYLPFASGSRNCIGYLFAETEMKSMLSKILRKFWLSPAAGKETLKVKFFVTLRAVGGVWVTLSPKTKRTSESPVSTVAS